ncbi:MAG: hypothetical protein NC918_08240 [Candidatus Omnitrophica bacterium]|nr:hypothetical protein [Candidatus Omnitrophota bacterium]
MYPHKKAEFLSYENIIVGNVCFYGATAGEAYISGIAGERFCIRNSGIYAVVESAGDHGCEYMTGGRVMILGKTGRNFAAGMSGGIAYVYDEDNRFYLRCNKEIFELENLKSDDINLVKILISRHYKYTQSKKAEYILKNFSKEIKNL